MNVDSKDIMTYSYRNSGDVTKSVLPFQTSLQNLLDFVTGQAHDCVCT